MLVDVCVWYEDASRPIHRFMAVCHTADVYLDRKSDASCVGDISNVFVSNAKDRLVLYTHSCVVKK